MRSNLDLANIGANSLQVLVHTSPILGEYEQIEQLWWALRDLNP